MKHRSGEHRGLCFGERRSLAKHSLLSTDGVRRTYDGSPKRDSGAIMADLTLPTFSALPAACKGLPPLCAGEIKWTS